MFTYFPLHDDFRSPSQAAFMFLTPAYVYTLRIRNISILSSYRQSCVGTGQHSEFPTLPQDEGHRD